MHNYNVAMKSVVMEELKAFIRPELLNDEMAVFRPVEKTQVCMCSHLPFVLNW